MSPSVHTCLPDVARPQHHDLHRLVGHTVQQGILRYGDQQKVTRPAAVHGSRCRVASQPHLAPLCPRISPAPPGKTTPPTRLTKQPTNPPSSSRRLHPEEERSLRRSHGVPARGADCPGCAEGSCCFLLSTAASVSF